MSVSPDYQAAVAALDDVTNHLGEHVQTLADAIDGAVAKFNALADSVSTRMTDEEVEAAKTMILGEADRLNNISLALQAARDTLNGLGADPSNPVPVAPKAPKV